MNTAARSILFLLPPGFQSGERREFCPECAELWGFLGYFPAIREVIEIRYAGIDHPRMEMIEILGDGRWNCPTLILDPAAPDVDGVSFGRAGAIRYLDSARAIENYFAKLYGLPAPRGGGSGG